MQLLDITHNNHGGNSESIAANQSIHDHKKIMRERIMTVARDRVKGITPDEIAAEWGCSHNHVAPRISELKAVGELIPTAERRATRSGCTARVLVAREFAS